MTKIASRKAPEGQAKTLLEKAAKAAGVRVKYSAKDGFTSYDAPFAVWNPLESDGDAMMLASKLLMCFQVDHDGVRVWIGEHVIEERTADVYPAFRLAIVRLAVEMAD